MQCNEYGCRNASVGNFNNEGCVGGENALDSRPRLSQRATFAARPSNEDLHIGYFVVQTIGLRCLWRLTCRTCIHNMVIWNPNVRQVMRPPSMIYTHCQFLFKRCGEYHHMQCLSFIPSALNAIARRVVRHQSSTSPTPLLSTFLSRQCFPDMVAHRTSRWTQSLVFLCSSRTSNSFLIAPLGCFPRN